MQQCKVKIQKKNTRRGHKRSTSRGTRKDQKEHHERCRKTPLGDSLSTTKLANFGCPCRRVRFAKKKQSETTKGAPERPEVLPKRGTSKSNQRAQMKHQKVQSETTNRAPEKQQKHVSFLVISIFYFLVWPAHPASQGRRQHHINSVFGIRRGMMIQTLLLSLGTKKFENSMYQTASAVVFCCAANFSCNWQLLAKL